MADTKKPIKTKKIADVARPGQSAPSPNSKSVIISHHPMLQDPMVTADDAGTEPEVSAPAADKLSRGGSAVLQPSPSMSADAVPAEPASTAPKPIESSEPAVAPAAKPTPIEDVKPLEPVPTDEAETSETELQTAFDAETARQNEIQEIIDSKKYYLPIATIETQRTKQFVIVGIVLSIILGLAWFDIALDAGLIHVGGLKSLTHFFH